MITLPGLADPRAADGTSTFVPDRVGIRGCTYIYAPAGQAGEYAPLATNPYRGCGNGCAYCYVPRVLRMSRVEFDAGAVPREDFQHRLERDARKYQAAGVHEQVMLSFTTDPYHPGDTSLTRRTLEVLLAHGMGMCTLTKGGSRALRDLDLFRPDRDAFASTLTSLDESFSLKWEGEAALPADRIATLRRFHDAGIFTWVSLEPVIDTAATLEIIRQTHRFVDLFKVGRANYLGLTKTTDWARFTNEVLDVLNRTGARHYIKKDLQPYLPPGYPNPKRIRQHHAHSSAGGPR
jgi:DNA repair photolyase